MNNVDKKPTKQKRAVKAVDTVSGECIFFPSKLQAARHYGISSSSVAYLCDGFQKLILDRIKLDYLMADEVIPKNAYTSVPDKRLGRSKYSCPEEKKAAQSAYMRRHKEKKNMQKLQRELKELDREIAVSSDSDVCVGVGIPESGTDAPSELK